MKTYLLFITVLFSVYTCNSQNYIYQHFGVDEGLPSSEVYDIYQDKLGYIWFATDKGLSRFNGYEFENFNTEDGLPDNTILDFYPQKNGEVWCYGYQSQELFYFDEIFEGFKSYKYNTVLKDNIASQTILKNVVINDGKLFTGGYALSGLLTIDKKGNVKHLFNKDSNIKSADNRIHKLAFEAKTNVFFILNHNYKLDDNYYAIENKYTSSSRVEVVRLNTTQSLFIDRKIGLIDNQKIKIYYNTKPNPIGIRKINDSLFFAGYYNNGAEIRSVSGKIKSIFLPEKSVSNFLIDAEGGYWFSTLDDGVFYIKNPNITILTQDHISSLVKTNDNQLYAGYHNGNVALLQQNKFEVLYKGKKDDDALVEINNKTNEVYAFGDRNLMNLTTNQLYQVGSRKLSENMEDGIISNYGLGFTKFVNNSVVSINANYSIQDVCLYKNNILLGTSFGLYIQKNDITIKHQPTKLLSQRIDDIDLNKNTNKVYMATQGAGVVVYGDSIYNISKKDGLTNDIVSEVHIENDSTIWACTNSGLNRITFRKNNAFFIDKITKEDGLLSNDIDDVEVINDTVYVATKKGLCYFNKEILAEKSASNILSISLKEITVNSKKISEKNIKLKYNQNNIDFKIEAISQKNTKNINYYYRLKEIDTTWTKTKNRTISFSSLSAGKYTFEAKATVFNNPNALFTNYHFKILPPFWQSWWFYTICMLLFFGLIYLFFKIRVFTYNNDIARELMRLTIKRLKRKELFYKFRSNGEDFKIPTHEILYINSQGNYLDIKTKKKSYTIRCKIGDFIFSTPDALEYLRVHRSYIIRIDKVSSKGKNWVVIKDEKIPVGETYLSELDKIQF